MAIVLGSEGLLEADLVLVQNVSFAATFTHVDNEGNAIDHDGWSKYARIRGGAADLVLDDCVSFGEDGDIELAIPASVTGTLALGSYKWDLMVETPVHVVYRIAYGKAKVYDSYAKDE